MIKSNEQKPGIVYIFFFLAGTICLFAWGCASSDDHAEVTDKADKENRVVGYVAGYRDFNFSTIQADKLTHINFAFVNIINGEVQFDTSNIDDTQLDAADIVKLQELKKINSDLKILVSVGGWVWSGNFSDAALTSASRKKLARSSARFVKDNQLDGIDFDWEYPNQVGAGNIHRPEDKQNLTLMLAEIRYSLDSLAEKEDHPGYLLTIATGADSAYIQNTELGEAQKYLDFLNIMTYDFHNGLHHQTGHHANLHSSRYDHPGGSHVLQSVDMHLDAGVPLDKINVGLAFYGRKWENVNPDNNGLYQEAESVGMIEYYRTIAENSLEENGYIRYWDDSALAPWLWNPDTKTFISYEDELSIQHKIDYVKEKGLSGVMFWEYSDDYESRLLDALHSAINEKELNSGE